MGLQRFPMGDFSGGVNFRDGPFQLENNELQDGLNVRLTQRGALKQRDGKTRFDSSGSVNVRADHMRNWYFGSTRVLIISADGRIQSVSTTGTVSASLFSGTSGTVWCFESMQDGAGTDFLWAMNGTDAAKKYDGTTLSNWAGTPPNGTMCRAWRNRMVVAGVAANPRRLFFSDIGNPETPITSYGTNWVDIKQAEDDTDPITWLEVLGDLLLVFKRRSVWAVYDDATFRNRRIGGVGCESRFQSVEAMGRVFFLARDGLYSLEGISGLVELESGPLGAYFQENIDYSVIAKARVGASRDRRVFVALPIGASSNSRLLELNLDFKSQRRGQKTQSPWFIHDYPVSSMAVFRAVNEDQLMAGDNGTEIHALFEGSSDDGAAISSYGFTGWKSFISEEPLERVRRLNMMMAGNLVLDVFLDLDNGATVFTEAMDVPVAADPLWSGGVWDGGIWTPSAATGLVRARPETRGRYHAFKFRNNQLGKTFTIYAVEAALRGGKEH